MHVLSCLWFPGKGAMVTLIHIMGLLISSASDSEMTCMVKDTHTIFWNFLLRINRHFNKVTNCDYFSFQLWITIDGEHGKQLHMLSDFCIFGYAVKIWSRDQESTSNNPQRM